VGLTCKNILYCQSCVFSWRQQFPIYFLSFAPLCLGVCCPRSEVSNSVF